MISNQRAQLTAAKNELALAKERKKQVTQVVQSYKNDVSRVLEEYQTET